MKKMECTICVAKTKALISCAVTAQLVCAFVFAHAKNSRFSHNATHVIRHLHHYVKQLCTHKDFTENQILMR